MLLREVRESKGTYAGVRFNTDTIAAIEKFQNEHGISNPVPLDKLHTTLLYSRKYLPDYSPAGAYDPPEVGKAKGFDVWESQADESGHKTKCLVMEFDCPGIIARHKKLMKAHDATYDFDEYKPHITLSYDFDGDVNKLPEFTNAINIVEEYGEDLNNDWANDNT